MIRSLHAAIALSATLCLASAVHAQDFAADFAPFKAALDRNCPAKHLDLLTPADLNEGVETYRESLPAADRDRLDQTSEVKGACAETTVGVSCLNIAYIRAATRLGLVGGLAKSVCKMDMACKDGGGCDARQ